MKPGGVSDPVVYGREKRCLSGPASAQSGSKKSVFRDSRKNVGPISPSLVKSTADPLFLDLWQRPALKPRDRSLITVSALIASGLSAQIGYHLNRAMDNGLSVEEAGEIVTQAVFYAGWPNAFTSAPVVGEVLNNRSSSKR